ncbi:iron-sulfur cluster assembly protein [Streptomyces thinghirensis]|nr:iron-sulfur cluster assembly protein [Streptomyces thinghirensis]
MATEDAVREALATVNDPEINRPITELGMVKSVEIGADGGGRGRRVPDGLRPPHAGHHHAARDGRVSRVRVSRVSTSSWT